MLGKIKKSLKGFDSIYSIGEKIYHIFAFIIIFIFGSISGFLASVTPVIKEMGYFGVFSCVVLSVLLFVLILYFYSSSVLSRERAKYYNILSNTKVEVNPLAESFNDEIIHLEDLRLPLNEPQKNKTFRRCRLVGPLAIFILSGRYEGCHFIQSGSLLALPGKLDGDKVNLAGVLIFDSCTFFECVFVNVTVITTQANAQAFKEGSPGVHVVGLN